jgi:DNA-binding NtrC family response regulator
LGAFDFLLKPYRLEDVEKSVERAVEFKDRQINIQEAGQSNKSDAWQIVEGNP